MTTYRVLHYRKGIPRLVSTWSNRFMAYQQAYGLVGLPFLEMGDARLAIIRSARAMVAVERVKEG